MRFTIGVDGAVSDTLAFRGGRSFRDCVGPATGFSLANGVGLSLGLCLTIGVCLAGGVRLARPVAVILRSGFRQRPGEQRRQADAK